MLTHGGSVVRRSLGRTSIFVARGYDSHARHMKRLIALLVAYSQFAMAAETAVHWRELGPAIAGKDVSVSLTDGKRTKGSAFSVEADSLTIETRKGRQSI